MPIQKGFEDFIKNLKESLIDLTEIMRRFFDSYLESGHYGGEFLKDTFQKWKGASTRKEEELRWIFCRETAYVFLNRILFTRILEDKEIAKRRMISGEEFAKLLRLLGKAAYQQALESAYKNVEKYYKHFYEYSIFDWWRLPKEKRGMLSEEELRAQEALEEELNFVVIRNILKRLNGFNFYGINQDILGDVYQEYLPSDERKRLGEFYTPIEVVKYILDATGYTPENEIEGKLLLDPACGSGTFLVEAATRLGERYERKGLFPRNPDDCKTIVERIINNIHGLDINPFACHIAEMNLLFNIIDYLHAIQSRYRDYKLKRFNICCTDSLVPPRMEEVAPTTEYINGRTKSYIEEAKRAKQVKEKQFDFVVGNPPYVRVQRLREQGEEYRKMFKNFAHGKFDIYVLFIGKGLEWLKENGKLGFITSNKFIKREYGQKIRKIMSNKCRIKQLVDLTPAQVFKDATNDPCIFVLEKKIDKKNLVKCVFVLKQKEAILDHVKRNLGHERYSDDFIDVFDLNQALLNKGPWIIAPKKEHEVFEKIKENHTNMLNELTDGIYEGLVTGRNKVFFIHEGEIKKHDFEEKFLKPLLKGEEVRKWRIRWGKLYILYPYEIVKTKLIPIDLEKYQGIQKYLEAHKEDLRRRRYYKQTPEELGKKWFEVWNPLWLDRPKIVTPDISDKNNFAYDNPSFTGLDGYYYPDHTCFIIFPKSKNEVEHLFILGLLNSSTLEFYFKHVSVKLGEKGYRYITQYLNNLPIRLPRDKHEEQAGKQIVQNVKEILFSNKQLSELEEKIAKFPELYFSVNKVTRDLAERAVHIPSPKDAYTIKSPTVEALPEKGLYRLWINKQDYIDFDHQNMAEYVRQCLQKKDKIRRDEMLKLKVPIGEHLEKITLEFNKDRRRTEEIKKKIQKLEKEIDELVYGLYDLNNEDTKIIEEFLGRF